ncbi:MAG TPA: Hsp20/alpha crystallin family protein [Steroidobacteraceae bacterium]|nr:Hsp20/alpha crystallin family protein [Steroidobacteraceae bacterium]
MSHRDHRSWMWAEALGLLEQAERKHRQFYGLVGTTDAQARWEPPIDVLELPPEIFITVALPGIEPERIELQLDEAGIAITAHRPAPRYTRGTVIRRLEIPYGRFVRRINLPAGRFELLEQALEHGCLRLRLRRH